jgi:hypothetical protein
MTETLWHVIHVVRTTSEKFNTFKLFFYSERIIIITMGFLQGWRWMGIGDGASGAVRNILKGGYDC